MTEFPNGISFKYSWRKYQQRVLDDLQDHLSNRHLHVIAPPGSGKTVLGLEVAIRLNKPTLILAPTIAIRNQWIQRFCELFLQTKSVPEWISRDIRNPKFLTVVTYQGLHAACNQLSISEEDFEEEDPDEGENENANSNNSHLDDIVRGLKAQNVGTIIVDEAHHLKNEWWRTLTSVKESINPVIVGLTATPPYDVSVTEWQRYTELNGPVDTEISVPELVIEGDLCPHQDYLHLTLPTGEEIERIAAFRRNIETLYSEIKSDEKLISIIESHPIWINPEEHHEWIYNNLQYYSASLIFLNANRKKIPKINLEIIGDKNLKIPEFDYHWAELLLDFYLYHENEHFKVYQDHRKNLENRLRRSGAIERRQINFTHNRRLTGFLTSSISKLNSIKDIVDFEYQQLGSNLRLVILTDYIRKEYFSNAAENNLELNKIGVIPIFEKLRRNNSNGLKIGVLTGSMIIIPKSAYPEFEAKARKYDINQINSSPVSYDDEYIVINQTDQLRNDIVHIITQIFQRGEIEVLIGTKSLLGQGWDAPAINSLILASFVGSFVLSNQMRGRAIRTKKTNPDKTANIWHLACIDPTSTSGGDDIELLKRRFRSFVGVSFKEEPAIENGLDRLVIPNDIHDEKEIIKQNVATLTHAGDRESLKKRWKEALKTGTTLIEEIKIPFKDEIEYKKAKKLYFNKTIGYLFAELMFGLMVFGQNVLDSLARSVRFFNTPADFFRWLGFVGIIGLIVYGKKLYTSFRLYVKYRDISKDIQQIGDALVNSLIKAGTIRTENSRLKVETSIDQFGAIYCHLEGATTFEKSSFIIALQEILDPIDNPRYVLIRKSIFARFIKQTDYHSVPEILGRNRTLAEYFKSQWKKFVGSCELIYTRSKEGRRLLLKSRVESLSSQFESEIEHVNKWK